MVSSRRTKRGNDLLSRTDSVLRLVRRHFFSTKFSSSAPTVSSTAFSTSSIFFVVLLLLVIEVVPIPVVLNGRFQESCFTHIRDLRRTFGIHYGLREAVGGLFLVATPILTLRTTCGIRRHVILVRVVILGRLVGVLGAVHNRILLPRHRVHLRLHIRYVRGHRVVLRYPWYNVQFLTALLRRPLLLHGVARRRDLHTHNLIRHFACVLVAFPATLSAAHLLRRVGHNVSANRAVLLRFLAGLLRDSTSFVSFFRCRTGNDLYFGVLRDQRWHVVSSSFLRARLFRSFVTFVRRFDRGLAIFVHNRVRFTLFGRTRSVFQGLNFRVRDSTGRAFWYFHRDQGRN